MARTITKCLHRSQRDILREAFSTHPPTEYQSNLIERGEQNCLLLNHLLIERRLVDATGEKYLARHLPSGSLRIVRKVESPTPRFHVFSPDWSSPDVRQELDAHTSRVPVRIWCWKKVSMLTTMAAVSISLASAGIFSFYPSDPMRGKDQIPPPKTVFSDESFLIE